MARRSTATLAGTANQGRDRSARASVMARTAIDRDEPRTSAPRGGGRAVSSSFAIPCRSRKLALGQPLCSNAPRATERRRDMSVLMTLAMRGDPEKLEEHAAGDPDGMQAIVDSAKGHGLIA